MPVANGALTSVSKRDAHETGLRDCRHINRRHQKSARLRIILTNPLSQLAAAHLEGGVKLTPNGLGQFGAQKEVWGAWPQRVEPDNLIAQAWHKTPRPVGSPPPNRPKFSPSAQNAFSRVLSRSLRSRFVPMEACALFHSYKI